MAPISPFEIHSDRIWYLLKIKWVTGYLLSNIPMKYCMLRLQHRTQFIHRQVLMGKWKTGVYSNLDAVRVTDQRQLLCIHFSSQDEQTFAQVETHFYFSARTQLPYAFKQTLFKPLTIKSERGMVFLQQNVSIWPMCRWAGLPGPVFILCQNTYMTSLCSISMCMKAILRGKKTFLLFFWFFPCF